MTSAVATLRRPPAPPREAPQATPCPKCSAPFEPDDAFCPACGAPNEHRPAEVAAAPAHGFRCENCGAEVRCDPDARSTTCPFCAAPYVVEYDPAVSGRQDPEFVIGFAIPAEKAEAIYRDWLGAGSFFRPGDLAREARAEGLRGIYLPFWSFSMKADSRWSANIGEHWYRTETYTTTDANGKTTTHTRQVQETEWYPLEGGHHAYYSFYLVSGSKGLPQAVSEWVQPFQLLALKRYAPRYLAGWLSEEYSIAREEALPRCQEEFRNRELAAIAAFLPGDTHSGLEVETAFSKVNSDLILLPIYLRSYRYRGKLYRTLINGQTGKVSGEKPVSAARVVAFIALIVGIILLIVLLARGVGR
jgi:hypothetical protein